MRRVLAGLVMVAGVCVALMAVPSWSETAVALLGRAAASVPVDPMADRADGAATTDDTALPKGDRLFLLREIEPDAAESETEAPAETVEAPAPERPELSTAEFCEALTLAAAEANIPAPFFARLIWQESKFRPNAVSPVGAKGVAQFMPATATEMGLDDPFDARKALPASARFLRRLHDQFGNLGLAAAAYNAGSGRIQNWLTRRGPLPDETRNYVRSITGNAAESWKAEKKTVGLQQSLPRTAPCEGIGGLSRDAEAAKTAVALAPVISGLIRKAEAEARAAAAKAKMAARLALLRRGKGKGKPGETTTILARAAAGKAAARIRVASAAK